MPLDKSVLKASVANQATYEFKPRELSVEIAQVARDFVDLDSFKSGDFKISDIVSKQSGISALEDSAQQERINAQVLERLKAVQEDAYREGHDLGLIEGTEKAYKDAAVEMKERLQALESIVANLEKFKERILIENEAELIRLVYVIAKKLALRDLEENSAAVKEILQHVIGELQADERVTVKLASEDLYFLETLQDKADQHLPNFERVKLVQDDSIKKGGCLVETAYGNVDATVEERLERAWLTLQARIPQNKPDTGG